LSLQSIVDGHRFQLTITALIVVNAVILGLETSAAVMARWGAWLHLADRLILGVFVVEITLRIWAHRLGFFRDPWGWFDFIIVAIALVPSGGPLAVLRTLRVLRVLRLVSVSPSMRAVVTALIGSLPGMGSIAALLLLLFYVFGVMATALFGEHFPQWFGTLGDSLYTLFQVMTLESWSMGIVRPVMEVFPYAWLFFVPFILLATFTMLNLFIAVVVNAMQARHEIAQGKTDREALEDAHLERERLHSEVLQLRDDLTRIAARLEQMSTRDMQRAEDDPP